MPGYWLAYLIIAFLFIAVFLLLWEKEKGATVYKALVSDLPLGVCVVDPEGKVFWFNQLFSFQTGLKPQKGEELNRNFPGKLVSPGINHWHNRVLYFAAQKINWRGREGVLYLCQDLTEEIRLLGGEKNDLPVLLTAQLDNRTEVLQTATEEQRPYLLGAIDRTLAEWAENLHGFLGQTGENRYLIILTQGQLKRAEKANFNLLDQIREIKEGNTIPLTLSIGIGVEEQGRLCEMGRLAQEALELAQERGGDQVVWKSPAKVLFFGGKSASPEKKTRVRTRLSAETLREMILQSSQVMIMGHAMADYDSMGACLGLWKAVQELGKKGWIIKDVRNPMADRLLELFPKKVQESLLKAGEGRRKMREHTLLIIVDTHKPSLLPEPGLLKEAARIAVIDHHRRGEEYIAEAELLYLETYASSSCELVTELLQYIGEQVKIGPEEASALLAGITVDTKNFVFQTGSRTFAAASYLRKMGADPALVQKLQQDDLQAAIQQAEVVSRARVVYGEIALGSGVAPSGEAQLLAAKVADAMLNIDQVNGSFVLWPFPEGTVAISARSNGKFNVQVIMEKLGGGGHLTIAAAQVPGTVAEAEELLLNALEEEFRKGEITS